MDDKFQKLKQATKIVLKTMSKPIIATIIVIVLVLTLISGFIYVVTLNDGSYKKGDKKNVSYAVEQHTGNVSIGSDGKITTGQSAKGLWDEMIKNKTRVSTYLNNASELKKLITAEMITNYLDTRANPNDAIDWTKYNRDVDSTEVQGIIKLKRAYDDGTNALLTYVDPDTFQDYIDEYNKTGSEADKKKALSHFTLEKGYNGSASFGSGEAIAAGTVINVPAGLGSVHTYMGWQMITDTSSAQYKLREQAGMNFDSEGFGRINGRYVIACTTTFGQPGDYVDFYQEDGTVIQCIIGDIKNQNDAGCTEWGHENGTCIIEFVVDKNTWYNTNHPNPGAQGFHSEWNKNITKAVNGGSYFNNPTFGSSTTSGDTENDSETEGGDTTSGESTIGNGLMKWPTDGTNITSYFGLRTAPLPGASTNHGAVDIGVPTGTNVYATESGTVTTAGYYGNAGNLVTIDHGNGYISKYMHNSSIKVSVGDKVTKGQVIAISGSTGNSTGPHVHFQIEYYGTKIDPLSFKYDNNMGDGTGGIGSNSDALSTNSKIYAKVATWNEVTDIITSDDPSVQTRNSVTYNMTSTKVDYEQLVSGYKMPFDYLWALLVVGKEKNFVFDLAELVYNSELVITVHDNLSTNTNVSVDTYTKKTKTVTSDVRVNVKYSSTRTSYDSWDTTHQHPNTNTVTSSVTEVGGPFEKETPKNYKTTHTVITKTNTIEAKVTRANVWIVDYTQDFTYQTPTATSTSNTVPYDNEEYPASPNRTDGSDGAGLGAAFRNSVQSRYAAQYGSASATIESLKSAYYQKTVNRKVTTTNTVEEKKYVASPAKIIEKTDKQSKEPNFVTLFNKHSRAANSIKDATSWLFEIMETSNDIDDKFIDLTKYLLYKATKRDFGVKEFDFEGYINRNQTNVGTTGSNIGIEWTKGWENEVLRLYMAGETSYSKAVSQYVSQDKTTYYSYSDGGIGATTADNQNFSYGVMWHNNGSYCLVDEFKQAGVDITSFSVKTGTAINVNAADNVMEKEWMEKRAYVTSFLQKNGIDPNSMKQNELDCLTDMDYQGWFRNRTGSFISAYRQGETSAAMQNWILSATFKNSSAGDERANARWLLWSQGIYKTGSGKVLTNNNQSTNTTNSGNVIVERAKKEIGKPYVYGQVGPTSYDCSGFVSYVLTGKHIRIGTTETFLQWTIVNASEAKPGYVVGTSKHCGIYIGNGQMIHAPHTGDHVKISPVQSAMQYIKPPEKYLK